jgi:hypothetical protein
MRQLGRNLIFRKTACGWQDNARLRISCGNWRQSEIVTIDTAAPSGRRAQIRYLMATVWGRSALTVTRPVPDSANFVSCYKSS